MKKLCTMLGIVFFVFAAFRMITAKDFLTTKRRINRGLGRYHPKTEDHSNCQLRHCNLLLFGIRPKTTKLEKCFVISHIKSPADIAEILSKSSPDIFILIIPSVDSLVEPEALSVMVQTLGNISVLLPANFSSGELSLQCQSLKENCHQLEDLQPILTQIKKLNEPSNFENAATKTVSNFGNNLNAKVEGKLFSLSRQVDILVDELCKRNKNRNRLVEILKDSGKVLLNSKNDSVDGSGLSLKDLLPVDSKSYDKNRPPKLRGKPTVVYFHVTVLSLDSINEESMTYVADIFLAQSWRDPRLRLPESMSEQYRILDVNWLHDIWRPDCFFKNAKQVTFHEISIPNHYVWLYHDKTILYISKLTLVLSCAMKFESYPHDIQTCYIMIESLSHTVQDLIFLWNTTDPLVVYPEIELPQLDISNNYTTDCTVQYSTGNFTCLAVVFTLKRRLGYHLLHTYIPSALIVVMSWISFWIKPEAIPARVTLGVTSLLTLGEIFGATQNTQSQQSLPPVSYVKAIDIWMSSCSVFVFLSLMEFAVVNNYMKPISMKTMTNYSENDFRSAGNCTLKSHQHSRYRTCYGKEAAFCIDRFSRYFFPFSFFILNAVYWSVFI